MGCVSEDRRHRGLRRRPAYGLLLVRQLLRRPVAAAAGSLRAARSGVRLPLAPLLLLADDELQRAGVDNDLRAGGEDAAALAPGAAALLPRAARLSSIGAVLRRGGLAAARPLALNRTHVVLIHAEREGAAVHHPPALKARGELLLERGDLLVPRLVRGLARSHDGGKGGGCADSRVPLP